MKAANVSYSYIWFEDMTNFTSKSCWRLSDFYGLERDVRSVLTPISDDDFIKLELS